MNRYEKQTTMEIPANVKEFMEDVDQGLSADRKYLSSKYFYDDKGSQIFRQIMDMPEYYLTNAEFEILEKQSEAIINATGYANQHFNIIELGAGDGVKTLELLKKCTALKLDFTYIPIDISGEAIKILEDKMLTVLPGLKIEARVGDYFQVLDELSQSKSASLFLFMGANIGNYSDDDASQLLGMLHQFMKASDQLLIGFDLQKHPRVISLAYDDPNGITRSFNLNLLDRINRELGANFNVDRFDFYCNYNPDTGEVRSYLVSLEEQSVFIDVLNKEFNFAKNELIYTEQSRKYTIQQIENLGSANGFEVSENFKDAQHYFVDSLWKRA